MEIKPESCQEGFSLLVQLLTVYRINIYIIDQGLCCVGAAIEQQRLQQQLILKLESLGASISQWNPISRIDCLAHEGSLSNFFFFC